MASATVSDSSGHIFVRAGRKALDPMAGLAGLLPGSAHRGLFILIGWDVHIFHPYVSFRNYAVYSAR